MGLKRDFQVECTRELVHEVKEDTIQNAQKTPLARSMPPLSARGRHGGGRLSGRVGFLKDSTLLADLPTDMVSDLTDGMREVRAPAGEVLFKEGDPGDAAFFIVEGTVGIEKGGIRLVDMSTGDCVGEFALIVSSWWFVMTARGAILPRHSVTSAAKAASAFSASGNVCPTWAALWR